MQKRETKISAISLIVYFVVYLLVVVINDDLWGNILSPAGAFFAAALLMREWRRNKQFSFWLFSCLGCLSWGVTDTLWFVWRNILGMDPEKIDFFMYLYILPNIFLVVATVSMLFPQIKKWNRLQLILDLSATLIVIVSGSWILFFNREFNLLLSLDTIGLTTFLYMVCDLFVLVNLFMLFLSARSFTRSWAIRIICIGAAIYALIDLVYCWQIFNGSYIPNSLVDGIYMGGLLLVAAGALLNRKDPARFDKKPDTGIPMNYGSSSRILALLVIPVLITLIRGFNIEEFIFVTVIITVHQAVSGIIQHSIWSEYLLQREKEINVNLETRINERTEELLKANRELDYLAKTDIVTGLNNRWYCKKELEAMMEKARPNEPIAIFYLDLDRFKAINDSYGHETGDAVLVEISRRLSSWKSPETLLARIGGDEFIVAVPLEHSEAGLEEIAGQILSCCSEPISIPPCRFLPSASIGIALYPRDARDFQALLKCADIAMYHAKSQKDKRYAMFNSEINNMAQRRHQLEILLKKANYDEEFSLYFQPQFHVPDGTLIGMESLLRWDSPEFGRIMPGEFIPIAEETGAIVLITEWVIGKAIAQITDWNKRYGINLLVGINISPNIISSNFIRFLIGQIGEKGAKPEWIDIEITESGAMNADAVMEEILTELEKIGVSISIDDFGTGYSSISYIKRFHIDRLKIAKPLIDNISSDPGDSQIVRAIVMMAEGMNIRTIAEGVEREEQCRQLVKAGCREIQGYLYGTPVPANEFENRWIAAYEKACPTAE